ncbi:unnamed protein product [Leptosia nina]|uniref:Alanine--tRNA ligase n=1 Tax=Leptosia nina TaxID=320188 RepID=A0AAV1JDR3_9NEOP
MLRIPVRSGISQKSLKIRTKSSSAYIRKSFIDYFIVNHGHKYVKSSSVVPLCDPTVPFVNAGMNQFKGVFLGTVDPPSARAVNSQKCVRVGGKHNDLDLVGLDSTHHTFFEMLGNWSFGDYYKKEACKMAWDLLLGPYRLKPDNLLVTYFGGDVSIGLTEDRECRDIWKEIGVPSSHLKDCDAKDNFWEMGLTGPCGPCTEIHYIHPDGSLTEIWNLVFIQCNREANGKVSHLRKHHVDTGMGLERMSALLQGVPSNYDTDLFRPIIAAIEKNSKVSAYGSSYSKDAILDQNYRRLADHARMISVCLADGVFPATSLNLKQIMRKSFKICSDVFQNPNLLNILYKHVAEILGNTYPELSIKEKDAILILEHEGDSYRKMRSNLKKKWKDLVKQYPEVEVLSDVELAGFALGYKEFKESVKKCESKIIPGEVVFKLYDTHGFQEDIIERIALLNNMEIDKKGFWKLLSQHKMRHKASFKEQNDRKGVLFDEALETIVKSGVKRTDDESKYKYRVVDDKVSFPPLRTRVVAILNENAEWIDFLEACETRPYYVVTESTNFYTEAGGQICDTGIIKFNKDIKLIVDSAFKIRDFVIHKGCFKILSDSKYVRNNDDVILEINNDRRLSLMRNHSGVHLLNAAIRRVLPDSVVCQIGSKVSATGLSLSLVVYGEKLSQKRMLAAEQLIRESIQSKAPVATRIIDSTQLTGEDAVMTVPGETYPEKGLRLVTYSAPLISRELCCGTHVPHAGVIDDFCLTSVKGATTHTPTLYALTGDYATQARELFCRTEKLSQVIDLADPERVKEEVDSIRQQLATLCEVGAPCGEHLACQKLLDTLLKKAANRNDVALQSIAETEIHEACYEAVRQGRRFVVHFLRCSYLMQPRAAALSLANTRTYPQTTMDIASNKSLHQNTDTGDYIRTYSKSPSTDTSQIVDEIIDNTGHLHPSIDKQAPLDTATSQVQISDVASGELPAMLMGCAGGVIVAVARVPQELVSETFTAEKWLSCILPIFQAEILPNTTGTSPLTHAQMNATKVSLINCEQMVQDAMRVAIKFAQSHIKDLGDGVGPTENRQQN